jgi:hypothetical protein
MIGNLILLPIKVNQEIQAAPFEKKKDGYAKHNLRMVQEVCKEKDWTSAQIEARQSRIAAWARARWSDI